MNFYFFTILFSILVARNLDLSKLDAETTQWVEDYGQFA